MHLVALAAVTGHVLLAVPGGLLLAGFGLAGVRMLRAGKAQAGARDTARSE